MNKSSLLIDERPLMVLPRLATKIGLNQAIALQQIHFWIGKYKDADKQSHYKDGRWWVYNTAEEWQANFPWWSIPTIRRIMNDLRDKGLVIASDKYNAMGRDRTLWYAVDYKAVERLELDFSTAVTGQKDKSEGDHFDHMGNFPSDQSDHPKTLPCDQSDHMQVINLITPLPKTTKEQQKNIDNTLSSSAFVAYENGFGVLSPIIQRKIEAAVTQYGENIVVDAISTAVESGGRSWKYVEGILSNWATDGKRKRGQAANAPRPSNAPVDPSSIVVVDGVY